MNYLFLEFFKFHQCFVITTRSIPPSSSCHARNHQNYNEYVRDCHCAYPMRIFIMQHRVPSPPGAGTVGISPNSIDDEATSKSGRVSTGDWLFAEPPRSWLLVAIRVTSRIWPFSASQNKIIS